MQACELTDQQGVLEWAGVAGAFIMTFLSPTAPYNEDPRLNLDMNSYSLVKSYKHGRHGTTYPDMTWDPKEAFYAVAEFFNE